jgi:hypothetical protein
MGTQLVTSVFSLLYPAGCTLGFNDAWHQGQCGIVHERWTSLHTRGLGKLVVVLVGILNASSDKEPLTPSSLHHLGRSTTCLGCNHRGIKVPQVESLTAATLRRCIHG